MEEFRQKFIHLHHCRGITRKIILQILKVDPHLHLLYQSPNKYKPLFAPSTFSAFYKDIHSEAIQKKIQSYQNEGIEIITYFDKDYPNLLKEIYDPPLILYGKGERKLLSAPLKLAVVGSRQATNYGKMAIENLFPPLIKHGVLFVSGLAKGIDKIVHEKAIQYGGKTIGVIAGGLYHMYPKENLQLAQYMMNHHLVISEFPPDTFPRRWHFPIRNRIISGLCRGTVVVEAKGKSGSLITANYAVQEGREVFAIPGSIFSENSYGTNDLIKQGAKLVQNEQDILDELLYYK